MNQAFARYDAAGKILFVGSVPASMIELQGGRVYVGVADPDRHWIDGGVLALRPPNPATLAAGTLSNLPLPCVIRINQASYGCAEPDAQLDFTYPGTYRVRVEAFPYTDAVFEVTVP